MSDQISGYYDPEKATRKIVTATKMRLRNGRCNCGNNQAIGNPRKSRFDRMMGESLIGRSLQENRRGNAMYFWVHWTWGKKTQQC